MASSASLRRIVTGSLVIGGSALAYLGSDFVDFKKNGSNRVYAAEGLNARPTKPFPTRAEQLNALKTTPEFDVLIIGGGATGSGVALDAVTRGLKTALVEMDDFSSGTSSRSTKLIHGGVRYLQKAIMKLDKEQYNMVKEALYERANLLKIAPHLSYPLPIMLPVYKLWQVPYYWFGIKMYDLVAGRQCLKSSYFLSKRDALEIFPMLKKEKLCGAIVYYDGQHNDARMNVLLALTAARHGAAIANHVTVTELIKKLNEATGEVTLNGAKVKDNISGQEFEIHAKCVINATGPFTDSIREMADENAKKICQPSSGVHIVLPNYYSPRKMGLLDPATSDGRVIFFLPWQGGTIAGTTDKPTEVTRSPAPLEEDIQFILREVRHYLSSDIDVRRGDVLSAWSGIRPLVLDPNKASTENIARNHIIHVSDSKLITIAGGKWTTYRSMAKETVDAAIEACYLNAKRPCQTDGLFLEGGHCYSPLMHIRLTQDFGVDTEVATHLAETYGDRAFSVAKLARLTGLRWPVVGRRLHPEFPYIEAEVRYAIREYAQTAIDVLARRLRISFLNVQAAEEALPRIVEIMAEELKWSKAEIKCQMEKAEEFLKTEMGMEVNKASVEEAPVNLSPKEINEFIKRFEAMDAERKGYISINDLRRSFKKHNENVSEQELHQILREVDSNRNGQVELSEYLQICQLVKIRGQPERTKCFPGNQSITEPESIPTPFPTSIPSPNQAEDSPPECEIPQHVAPCPPDFEIPQYVARCPSDPEMPQHVHACPPEREIPQYVAPCPPECEIPQYVTPCSCERCPPEPELPQFVAPCPCDPCPPPPCVTPPPSCIPAQPPCECPAIKSTPDPDPDSSPFCMQPDDDKDEYTCLPI